MKTKTKHTILYARVKPQVHDLLRRLAKETDRTMTVTIERIIEAAWKQHKESRESQQ